MPFLPSPSPSALGRQGDILAGRPLVQGGERGEGKDRWRRIERDPVRQFQCGRVFAAKAFMTV